MKETTCKDTGIIFNDWVDNIAPWARVCEGCIAQHNLPDDRLGVDGKRGVCGVRGCDNMAHYCYEFQKGE